MTEGSQMFRHAWNWIKRSTKCNVPHWFCAKCGERLRYLTPDDDTGCPIEK
jgi:hypothetical protein